MTAPTRSRGVRAARRASRGACCAGVRDFAIVDDEPVITRAIADGALRMLDVDDIGLDQMDRRYLDAVAISFGGGPVGIETIAASLSEPRDAIEDIIEPYLIQLGFLSAHASRPPADAATPSAISAWPSRRRRRRTSQFGLFRPSAKRRERRRPPLAGARLLRGHGFFRRRLPRQLPALSGAGPHRNAARGGHRAVRLHADGADARRPTRPLPSAR